MCVCMEKEGGGGGEREREREREKRYVIAHRLYIMYNTYFNLHHCHTLT